MKKITSITVIAALILVGCSKSENKVQPDIKNPKLVMRIGYTNQSNVAIYSEIQHPN
jgi:PBP1b-binding outer membrane lipoprotein LpoB